MCQNFGGIWEAPSIRVLPAGFKGIRKIITHELGLVYLESAQSLLYLH